MNGEPRHRSEQESHEEMLGGSPVLLLAYLVMLVFAGEQGVELVRSDAGPWLRGAGATLTGLCLVSPAPLLLRFRPPTSYDWSMATRGLRVRRAALRWTFWTPEIALGSFWLALVARQVVDQVRDPADAAMTFVFGTVASAVLAALVGAVGWAALKTRGGRR